MGVSPGSTKAVDNDYRSDIYSNSKNVKKSQSYLRMVPSKGAWSIFDRCWEGHAIGISAEYPPICFQIKPWEIFEPTVIEYVDVFCRKLVEKTDAGWYSLPRSMTDLCQFSSIDLDCRCNINVSLQASDWQWTSWAVSDSDIKWEWWLNHIWVSF